MKFKLSYMTLLAMILVTISTTLISLVKIDSNEHYNLLFLLPLSFFIMIIVIIKFGKKYLFNRITILITVFLYFFRNVIVPLFLVFGQYSTHVPDRFLVYMPEAIILCVYEMTVISLVLAFKLKHLNIEEQIDVEISDDKVISKAKYPFKIKFIIILFLIYILYIALLDFTIIRQTFMLMVGTPGDWYIRTNYRAIGSEGPGVLGVFATMVNTVFWIIQAVAPAIALNWVIKNKSKEAQIRWIFFIAFIVLMIVTGTRIHALECAVAIIWIGLIIFGDKMRKKLLPFALIGFSLTLINLLQKSGISSFETTSLSKMVSSYFGGVQNVAASIYASKNITGMNISLLPADVFLKLPYLNRFFENRYVITSGSIFNLLIGDGSSSGQILPSIGQGYIYFGFLLSPIIPSIGIIAAISFERKARLNKNLIYKNVYYIAAIMMARVAPSTNMMSGVQYLFYTYLTLFVVDFGMNRFKIKNVFDY